MRDIKFNITKAEEGAAFAVHVVPKAGKNEVVGKHGDALKIHLTSNTVGGVANDMLINFISEKLDIKPKNIEIIAGLSGAEKMVIVVGVSPKNVEDLMLS
jgi:hypothetical protein